MRPSDKFSKVMRVLRFCSSVCGADVLSKNFRMNLVTYCVFTCIACYFMCLEYTFYVNVFTNVTFILESFCLIGTAIQGLAKLLCAVVYKKLVLAQYETIKTIYERYEAKGVDYSMLLDKTISRVRVVLQIAACLYCLAFLTMVLLPLFFLGFSDKRFLPLQFYIPVLDVDTNFGYFATVAVHTILLFFGFCGNFASDMYSMVYFAHSALFVDIFKLKADELNKAAIDYGSQKVQELLTDVMEWHRTYTNYLVSTEVIFFWINFVQVLASTLSIVLTLVLMFISDWPGSYIYTGLAFSMLYLYCGIGTLVEISNERFMDEIYAIHWYLLTVPQQKAVRFMLMMSQSPISITVGGIAPLSVRTGLQVTKSAYSFFMMMLNFLH